MEPRIVQAKKALDEARERASRARSLADRFNARDDDRFGIMAKEAWHAWVDAKVAYEKALGDSR